jgi:hypothetical protein
MLLHRIYCELELNLRIGPRKRLKRPKPDALVVPEDSNQTWSMDIMQDQFADGRKLRTLDVFHEDYAGAISLQVNVICMAQNTSVVCLKHGLRHAAFTSNTSRQACRNRMRISTATIVRYTTNGWIRTSLK